MGGTCMHEYSEGVMRKMKKQKALLQDMLEGRKECPSKIYIQRGSKIHLELTNEYRNFNKKILHGGRTIRYVLPVGDQAYVAELNLTN